MTTYRERREERVERLREWSEKRELKAEAELRVAHERADQIPFGQPILVGHHSERRDRRYRESISRSMERGLEHQRKAESMASRADNIADQLAGSIYSDDPDAVEQLEKRITELEAERDAIKAFNASCRRGEPDDSLLTARQLRNLESVRRHSAYSLGKNGAMPSYALSNLTGNIARNRKRLEALKREGGS